MNLRTRSKPFNKSYLFTDQILKEVSQSSWWKSIDPSRQSLSSDVINKICSLQTAVASSASIERVFSCFGLVHSKLRNRLGVEKAGKLVFIHKNLNMGNVAEDMHLDF